MRVMTSLAKIVKMYEHRCRKVIKGGVIGSYVPAKITLGCSLTFKHVWLCKFVLTQEGGGGPV